MNDPEREKQIGQLAVKISHLCKGEQLDVAFAAAALFMVCQVDLMTEDTVFTKLAAQKLRAVADIVDPDLKDPT